MRFVLLSLLAAGVFCTTTLSCVAQEAGASAGSVFPSNKPVTDTNMIFASPRPLIQSAQDHINSGWGLDVLFSNFGFGIGGFYQRFFSRDVTGFVDIDFSGVKSPNENDTYVYDPYTGALLGPAGKVNDIYMIPITFGVQYRLFADAITESFRPYIDAGFGPTIIIAAPDSLSFFSGFAHALVLGVPEFFAGIGANFGKDPHSIQGVNFRYYYIKTKNGIESITGQPITDFGGFFITLNWGVGY